MSMYGTGGIRNMYKCIKCDKSFDFKIERDTHE